MCTLQIPEEQGTQGPDPDLESETWSGKPSGNYTFKHVFPIWSKLNNPRILMEMNKSGIKHKPQIHHVANVAYVAVTDAETHLKC